MDEILEQAQKLAQLMASHERTRTFQAAAAAVEADPEASRTQETYAAAVDEVRRREAEGLPLEPEQKRAMAQAADAVRRSPILVRMLKAHAEYMELMEAVQHVLAGGHEHEHGPDCDHGSEEAGAAPHASGREEETPPKSGGVLWTP